MKLNGHTNGAMEVLGFARRYLGAGLSILPIKLNGSKAPACAEWKEFQFRLATDEEVTQHFGTRLVGIGILGGKVSGGLELIDIDEPKLVAAYEAAVEELAPGLLGKLSTVETPRAGGGRHYRYRCSEIEIPGNTKLAATEPLPAVTDEGAPDIDTRTGKQRVRPQTLIETRGQGGYGIAPGSPLACHKSNRPYQHIRGPELTEVAEITAEERELLFNVARSFNRYVEHRPDKAETSTSKRDGLSPGDDFNHRATWEEILGPAGWKRGPVRGDVLCWTRPGKSRGISATTGLKSTQGNELLCVFTLNGHPFEVPAGKSCGSYSKFAAYALLNHNGDYSVAAKVLAGQGYGECRPPSESVPVGLANAIRIKTDEESFIEPIPIDKILKTMRAKTNNWPRSVGGTLFVDDPQHGLSIQLKTAELFGWLQSQLGCIEWSQNATGCVKQAEFFAEVQRTAMRYRAVSALPHFPPFKDHYYSHKPVTSGNGATLNALVQRFNPATQLDRELIRSAFVLFSGMERRERGRPSLSRPTMAVAPANPNSFRRSGNLPAVLLKSHSAKASTP